MIDEILDIIIPYRKSRRIAREKVIDKYLEDMRKLTDQAIEMEMKHWERLRKFYLD